MLKPGTTPKKFKLNNTNTAKINEKEVEWKFGDLSASVFYRTYSRKKEDGSQENWNDCVIRVIEGMFTILKTHSSETAIEWDERKAQALAIEAAERMFVFKWTPPGRGLWMMGTDLIWAKGSASLNNCGMISTADMNKDDIESVLSPFQFLGDFSFYGVGIGFDTKARNNDIMIDGFSDEEKEIFIAPDTREGWVEAFIKVIENGIYGKPRIELDSSLIRAKGEPIKSFGGDAPGPLPLIYACQALEYVIDREQGSIMNSAFIHDVMNIMGRAVVSGGVRRSAEIVFSDTSDKDFGSLKDASKHPIEMGSVPPIELKLINEDDYNNYFNDMDAITEKYENEDWAFKFGGWRWASNDSYFAIEGETDYNEFGDNIALNGEPGIMWLEKARKYGRMKDPINNLDQRAVGSNPCVEQTLESFELCCLVENYPFAHEDYWDFQRTLKFSYLYAKAVTLLGTHNAKTNRVMSRNRRIGSSMTGITEAISKFGRHKFMNEFCDKGYNYLKYVDEKYSDWLGVRESIKKTSVKPSGSVSLLGGAAGPGIHFPKMTSGYRLVQIHKHSKMLDLMEKAGYKIEASVYNPVTTSVIYFPWLVDENVKADGDATMWEKMKMVADLQHYWADNQVSCTITFNEDEKKDIVNVIEAFEPQIKSVSFLPLTDHSYAQAPFTPADRDEVIEYQKTLKKVNWKRLGKKFEDKEAQAGNSFCDSEGCAI